MSSNTSKVAVKKDEEKAIKDAQTVAENAPDDKTKAEAASTLAAAGGTGAQKPLPNPKPAVKSYDIASLKRNPFADVAIADPKQREESEKERKSEFDKLSEDDKKKFVIKAKLLENRYLDKSEQHEVSLEDERLAGITP